MAMLRCPSCGAGIKETDESCPICETLIPRAQVQREAVQTAPPVMSTTYATEVFQETQTDMSEIIPSNHSRKETEEPEQNSNSSDQEHQKSAVAHKKTLNPLILVFIVLVALLSASSVVLLQYVKKNATIKTPNLLNADSNSAKQKILYSKLQIGSISYEYNETVPKEDVIRQSPSANTSVSKGTVVNLVISKGIQSPDPPTNVQAVALSSTVIQLEWLTSARAEYYEISRTSETGNTVTIDTNIKDTTYVDSGIYAGRSYSYIVSAINDGGKSSSQLVRISIEKSDTDKATEKFSLGESLMKQNRYSEAEICFKEAVQLTPDNADCEIGLGKCLQKENKYEEAETYYRKAVGLKPDSDTYLSDLGILLFTEEKYAEAEPFLKDAVHLEPGIASYQYNEGAVLFNLGKYAEAEPFLKDAVRLEPDNDKFKKVLADCVQNKSALPQR